MFLWSYRLTFLHLLSELLSLHLAYSVKFNPGVVRNCVSFKFIIIIYSYESTLHTVRDYIILMHLQMQRHV